MLLQRSVEHDSRVQREAQALADAGHHVTVAQLATSTNGPARDWQIHSVRPAAGLVRVLPRAGERALRGLQLVPTVRRLRPDVVHAHDIAMLLPGWAASRAIGARLVYDTHELATGVPYRSARANRVVGAMERALMPRCDAVVTVSQNIADRLAQRYRLACPPAVVRNVSALTTGGVAASPLRAAIGATPSEPVLLHQGAAGPDRGDGELVRALAHVDGARLVFLGHENDADRRRLERIAAEVGVGPRLSFLPVVALGELLDWTRGADVGLSLLQVDCENHRLTLPNKVFEYVAAGLPIVASRSPALQALVAAHGIGWTVDPTDPVDVARGMRAAIAARDDGQLSARLRLAARELTWDRERERLLEAYAGLSRRRR